MKYISALFCILFTGLLFILAALPASAQQAEKGYELLPAPDLWYNDVDGIRIGIRLKGQVPGTFEDGPHRLDAGLWLGTWFPSNPVSYYVAFTEPIQSLSDFGSEANIKLVSSLRTGFNYQGISFNKRWQAGFNENNYKELSLGFHAEGRTDLEYVPYPQVWKKGWLFLADVDFILQDENALGRYRAVISNSLNVAGDHSSFISSSLEFQQLLVLSQYFQLRGRVFAGAASNSADAQYLFSRSMKSPRGWMGSGMTRAKGTIPSAWMGEGFIQVAGGANLRGYLAQENDLLDQGLSPMMTSVGAFNAEVDYPNPINQSIKKIPVIGGILKFRSYLFFDTGTSLGITDVEESRLLSDAGPGFMLSLNVPDYLGKPRGFVLRYDLPIWISNPDDGNHFKFRNVLGIGAVISL